MKKILFSILAGVMPLYGQDPSEILRVEMSNRPVMTAEIDSIGMISIEAHNYFNEVKTDLIGLPLFFDFDKVDGAAPQLDCRLAEGVCEVSSGTAGSADLVVWNAERTREYKRTTIIFTPKEQSFLPFRKYQGTLIITPSTDQGNAGDVVSATITFPTSLSEPLKLITQIPGQQPNILWPDSVRQGQRFTFTYLLATGMGEWQGRIRVQLRRSNNEFIMAGSAMVFLGSNYRSFQVNFDGDSALRAKLNFLDKCCLQLMLARGSDFLLPLPAKPRFDENGFITELVYETGSLGFPARLPAGSYTVVLASEDLSNPENNNNFYQVNGLYLDREQTWK